MPGRIEHGATVGKARLVGDHGAVDRQIGANELAERLECVKSSKDGRSAHDQARRSNMQLVRLIRRERLDLHIRRHVHVAACYCAQCRRSTVQLAPLEDDCAIAIECILKHGRRMHTNGEKLKLFPE